MIDLRLPVTRFCWYLVVVASEVDYTVTTTVLRWTVPTLRDLPIYNFLLRFTFTVDGFTLLPTLLLDLFICYVIRYRLLPTFDAHFPFTRWLVLCGDCRRSQPMPDLIPDSPRLRWLDLPSHSSGAITLAVYITLRWLVDVVGYTFYYRRTLRL